MNEDFDIKGDLNFGDVGFDIGDIDSSLFEVDFDGGDQIETRYVRPTLKPIKESQILYSNAEKLAKEIDISKGFRYDAFISGNFIFGDFIEAFLTNKDAIAKKMVVSTLSLSQNNIDSFKNLLEYGWIEDLSLIGEDVNREGLQGTPDRIARMYDEIFRGYDAAQKPKITTFENGKDGITYENMIIDEGDFYSMCEHHMMPFFGRYWFAYIPNPKGRILGISKIGRVVDYCAAKLQIQERLVREIVDILSDALKSKYPPLGVALVMEGEHLCKSMRGAKKKGKMKSSYLVGAFKDDAQLRNEFFNLIK